MANDNIEFDIVVNGKKAKKSIKEVEGAQEDLAKTTKETSKSISMGWVKIAAAVFAAKKAFDFARDIDALETRMTVALGTTEGMVEQFGNLRKFADDLGLSFESLASSYVNFKVASDLANVASEETEKIFKAVSTAGGAMKLSTDDMRGIFKALEQMMSKGTVQAEELRGQLGERLPGAFTLAANAMGVTTMELNKMMEQGELLARDLLPKLADELNNKFADGAIKSSKSIQASYNRLGNVFTDFKGIVLNVLDNIGLVDYFSKAIAKVDGFTSSILRSSKAVNELSKAERSKERLKALQNIKEAEEGIARAKTNFIFKDISYETAVIKANKEKIRLIDETGVKTEKIIAQQKEKVKNEKDLAEASEKASTLLANKAVFETAYLKATTTQQQQKIKALDEEYAAYAKFTTDKVKLDEWYSAAKTKILESSKAGKSTAKALEKELDMAKSINDSFWDDYKHTTMDAMDYELSLLSDQYAEYDKYVKDKSALNEWYATEQKRIMDENNLQLQVYNEMQMAATDHLTDALIGFAETGKISFSEMARSMISDLARIQIQASMMSLMTGLLGGGGGTSILSGLFAQGAAFSNGKVTPFANGGVVSSPTLFPMANGAGLMGEAGAEAIMPLTRTSGGDLGVKMEGGGTNVNVNVQNYGNDEVKVEQNGNDINVIISQIASSIQRGTGDIGTAIEGRYGIRKA